MDKEETRSTTICLPASMLKKAKILAVEQEISMGEFIRQALDKHITDVCTRSATHY